jgi:hypothetical protein
MLRPGKARPQASKQSLQIGCQLGVKEPKVNRSSQLRVNSNRRLKVSISRCLKSSEMRLAANGMKCVVRPAEEAGAGRA